LPVFEGKNRKPGEEKNVENVENGKKERV